MTDHGEYWAIGGSRADIVCIDQVGTPLTRAPAAEYYGVIVMPIEQSRDSKQFSAFELSGWDANIGGYNSTFGAVARETVEPMLDAARVTRGMRVLDICCGPGILLYVG